MTIDLRIGSDISSQDKGGMMGLFCLAIFPQGGPFVLGIVLRE